MGLFYWTYMTENNRSRGLILDQSEIINQSVDQTWLICFICVLSIMVNIWAARVLKTKEDTYITKLINWEFVSSILIAVEGLLFNLEAGFPFNSSAICAIRNSTMVSLIEFTRLIPVAIVLFRYIAVCHPVFFLRCGKEKGIWKWILGFMTFLCLSLWIYHIYTSSINFRFLRCMGREEEFG